MQRRLSVIFLAPAMAMILATRAYPMVYAFYLSLTDLSLIRPRDIDFIGFANYIDLFSDPVFLQSFTRTILFAVCVVAIELLLGTTLAYLFDEYAPTLRAVRVAFLTPMVLTPVVVALIWKYMYQPDYGVINYVLQLIGMEGQSWTSSPQTALLSVAIVDIWQWTPFMFLIAYAAFQAMPKEFIEAAEVDGASRWQTLLLIVLPMIRNIILVGILLRFIEAYRLFDAVFVLTRGGPGHSTELLSVQAYLRGLGSDFNIGEGIAISILMLLVSAGASAYMINLIWKRQD